MSLSNQYVIPISLMLSSFPFFKGKDNQMDSKLASSLTTLASNVSTLTKAISDFVTANGTPPVTQAELTSVLGQLDSANASITSAITTLTPATVTITNPAPAAPPSSF